MGEVKGCKPDPIDVRIVRDLRVNGVPERTINQFLIRSGIFRNVNPDTRAQFVEDFNATLEMTEYLRPLQRETIANAAPAVVIAAQTVTLSGVAERIRVIRAVEYFVQIANAPDEVLVSFGAQTGVGAIGSLFQGGSMPASGRDGET